MHESISRDWHALSVEQNLQQREASAAGLSSEQARLRLQQYGPNVLPQRPSLAPWRRFLLQFHNLLIYVLLGSMLMTLVLGEWLDSGVIFAVVLINAVIGFIQEYRAERAMAALKQLAAATARVLRDGAVTDLPASDLVPGDVVLLEAGNVIPADLRLFESVVLKTEEAALTGESVHDYAPVMKAILRRSSSRGHT